MGGGSESVELDGGTIAFERRGRGPALVLVHGAVSDCRDWRPQLEALKRSPLPVGEALHAQIRGSKFVVIPGPGHMVNREAPERFNEEVRSFLLGAG